MHTVAVVLTLLIIAATAYGGYKNGAFFSTYALTRNLFGFLVAMTLFEPVGAVAAKVFGHAHPVPLYCEAVSFVALFIAVFVGARYLKVRFTPATVPGASLVDQIGGGFLGLVNGILIAGFVLIVWSLMPFAKFIPADFGRVDAERLPVDAGGIMLRFYGLTAKRMPGGRVFLVGPEEVLNDQDGDGRPDTSRDIDQDGTPDPVPGEDFEDANGNGRWDRGWLWRYRSFAEITRTDLQRVSGVKQGAP